VVFDEDYGKVPAFWFELDRMCQQGVGEVPATFRAWVDHQGCPRGAGVPTDVEEMIRVLLSRWHVEKWFERAKQEAGLGAFGVAPTTSAAMPPLMRADAAKQASAIQRNAVVPGSPLRIHREGAYNGATGWKPHLHPPHRIGPAKASGDCTG